MAEEAIATARTPTRAASLRLSLGTEMARVSNGRTTKTITSR